MRFERSRRSRSPRNRDQDDSGTRSRERPPRIARDEPTSGDPLEREFRTRMERAFQTDFSTVRVHETPRVRDIGVRAYTRGENVYVDPAASDTTSPSGRRLFAHELTHVVQQRANRVSMPRRDGPPINDDTGLEREADRAAAQATVGTQVSVRGRDADAPNPPAPADGPIQGYFVTDPDDVNWDPDPDDFTFGSTLLKQESITEPDRKAQYVRDARIWYNTLFTGPEHRTAFVTQLGKDPKDSALQHQIRSKQMAVIRHILAIALTGWEIGTRYRKQTYKTEWVPPKDIPLVALLSHGGRFLYQTDSGVTSQRLRNLVLTGRDDPLVHPSDTVKLFQKFSTHSASLQSNSDGDTITEEKLGKIQSLKEGSAKRMPIALGGLGTTVATEKQKSGISRRKKDVNLYAGPDGYLYQDSNRQGLKQTSYQHGAMLIKRAGKAVTKSGKTTSDEKRLLMIGFENSLPLMSSPIGGAHDVAGTVGSASLTGGPKGEPMQLPLGVGGMVSNYFDAPMLEQLRRTALAFETLGPAKRRKCIQELLLSTPQTWTEILDSYGLLPQATGRRSTTEAPTGRTAKTSSPLLMTPSSSLRGPGSSPSSSPPARGHGRPTSRRLPPLDIASSYTIF